MNVDPNIKSSTGCFKNAYASQNYKLESESLSSSSSLTSTLALTIHPYAALSFISNLASSHATPMSSMIKCTATSGTNTDEINPVTPPQNLRSSYILSFFLMYSPKSCRIASEMSSDPRGPKYPGWLSSNRSIIVIGCAAFRRLVLFRRLRINSDSEGLLITSLINDVKPDTRFLRFVKSIVRG